MPANNVRLGGAYFTFTADARGYEAGANRAVAANRRLAASYGQFTAQLQGTQVLAAQFAQSLRSSLLATAAYAAGVGLASSALRGVIGGFLEYDRALIQISKTTDISGEELERLGQRIQALGTGPSGLRPALPILREELFAIATAAGQAGVATSAGIERITRAAAELQVSSNLIGSDAVRALTRYLNVTGQSLDRTDAIASAYTHLGNNIVGTEAEIASFATRVAQNLSAVGRATDEFILGVSATLTELDVQQEAAGSALQRTQIALLRLADDPSRFHAFADAIGGTSEEVEALRRRFVDGTASAEDFDRVFLAFLRRIRETGPTRRQSFIADIIGGGEANVRNTRVLGVLAQRYDRLSRNIDLSAEATEQANFHTREAARAAEAQSSALQIVGNRLLEQATAIGSVINPALISIAENFEVVEVAAAATAAAVASGFVRRRVTAFRDAQRETAQASAAAAANLNRHRTEIVRTDEALRRSATNRRTYTATFARERDVRRDLTQATRAQAAAETAHARATASAAAQRAQVGGVYGALGRSQIDRDAVRTRQALDRANSRVQRSTAALASIEAQRSAIGIRNSREYAQAVRAEQRQRARLNSLRAQAAEAQRGINRQMSLGTRLSRSFGNAVNFLGGPIGLVTTALTLGATAWLLWGGRASEAEERIASLRDEVEQTVRTVESAGLTETGDLIRRLEEELTRQQTRADLARESLGGATPRQAARRGLGDELAELRDAERVIADLEADLERLREIFGESGDSARDMARAALQSFERLPPSIVPAIQAVRNFRDATEDRSRAALALAREERRALGLSAVEQRAELEIARERGRIEQFQTRQTRQLLDAEERLYDARSRVDQAAALRDELAVGSEARKLAEQQLATEAKKLVTLEDQVAALRVQQRIAAGLEVPEENIRRRVRIEEATEDRRRFRQRPAAVEPDVLAEQQRVADDLRQLQDRLAEQRYAASLQRSAATEAESAAQAAANEVEQRYIEIQEEAQRAVTRTAAALDRVRDQRVRTAAALIAQLDAGEDVTDQQHRQLQDLRREESALAAQLVEREAAAEAIRGQAEAYQRLADASAEFARQQVGSPLEDFAAQAVRLRDRLEEVAAQGFEALGDSITDLVLEGKASFSDLANSIIRDLLRVLVQAQVVAPLVQSLTGLFGGFGGASGFNPSFGGQLGLHTGGVSQHAPQRLHRPTGLRGDELFAVLQRGEIVVPRGLSRRARYGGAQGIEELRQWIARLPRFHEGGVAGGGFGAGRGGVTRLELINQSNTNLEAVDNGTRVDGDDYVTSVILRDVRSRGRITRSLSTAIRGG